MKLKFKINLKKVKFEKHILIIFGMVFFTFIISLYIFSLILSNETKNVETSRQLRRTNSKLKTINRYSPTPTTKNIALVKKDVEYMELQLFDLNARLGNPYILPLVNFINTLDKNKQTAPEDIQSAQDEKIILPPKKADINQSGEKSEDLLASENLSILYNFLISWQKYYKENKADIKDIDATKEIFISFIKNRGNTEKEYDNAFKVFQTTLQKESYKEINDVLAEDFLLNSIGFPMRISRIQCKELIKNVQNKIDNELHTSKIMSSSQIFTLFDEFTAMPNDDQIPYIINYLWFYQDLVKKIIDSEIESFPTHNKLNKLRGTTVGDITTLKYEIEVIGSLDSVRKLIDEFQSSYKNNRVYSIDFVSFKKAIDNAENLPIPQKRKRRLNIEVIIGTSELIKANIKISYYIYNKPLILL